VTNAEVVSISLAIWLFIRLEFIRENFIPVKSLTLQRWNELLDWNKRQKMRPEAYHLEAYNSEPMLGFFSKPIKIYFLIWSVGHCMSRYLSNGRQICCFCVLSRLSFLNLFLRSPRESNESFLRAASVIWRPYIVQVSITGKNFFVSKQVWKSCYVENVCWAQRSTYSLLVVCWETGISIVDYFCMKFSSILKKILGLPMFLQG